jgi:type II protein arginine methyltransferase
LIGCKAQTRWTTPAIALADVATVIVARNGYGDRNNVNNRRSTQLRVGAEPTAPADVVIAEVLDVGVLGEGVLPTLRHAVRTSPPQGPASFPPASSSTPCWSSSPGCAPSTR